MPRFSVGVTTGNPTAGQPIIEIIPPTGKTVSIVAIVGAITVATASFYAIARAVNRGVTPSGIVLGEALAESGAPARKSQTQFATTWAVAPSGVNVILAHLITAAVIGGKVEWRPTQPVAVGGSLLVYNFVASAAGALFTIEFDED